MSKIQYPHIKSLWTIKFRGDIVQQALMILLKRSCKKMKESNLISYVFTSDNKEVKKIFDMGANIVGTNFLE